MSTKKYYGEQRDTKTSLFIVRIFARKLQTSLTFLEASRGNRDDMYCCNFEDDDDKAYEVTKDIPSDVNEGHFVVIAQKGSERKRFVLKLEWLNSPEFLGLLNMAEEEYGFEQTGVLVVPCRPQELEKILMAERR